MIISALDFVEYFQGQRESHTAKLRALVELESHSEDKEGVAALGNYLASELRSCGATIRTLDNAAGGAGLQAVLPSSSSGSPVMLLGHLDTVWPRGTIERRPFRLEGGKAYGPGVFDMKAGLLLCLLVAEAFAHFQIDPGKEVCFFFSPDEEVGSQSALPHLEAAARMCRTVLCLEPSLPMGKVKTFRKGVGTFRILVRGVAAHAGVDPTKGASAILELCRQVSRIQEMNDRSRGITVNVGKIKGGSAVNVVAEEAEAAIDLRVRTVSDGTEMEHQIRSLTPIDSRCTLAVQGGIGRPPLERSPDVVALFEQARRLAAGIGMELGEGETGGGSDGSFTAAMGIPTLDGLGVEGDGAHAVHEHVILDDIPRRAALLCELVRPL